MNHNSIFNGDPATLPTGPVRCQLPVAIARTNVELTNHGSQTKIKCMSDAPYQTEPSYEALLNEIRRGSEAARQAFDLLYDRFAQSLSNFVSAQCRGNAFLLDRDAIVQEAFLRLWLKPPEVGTNPTGWLMKTAKNLIIDAVRRAQSERRKSESKPPPATHPLPPDIMQLAETVRKVQACIARLPEPEQTVTKLRMQGVSAKQVAKHLNTTGAKVDSIYHRAKATLRTCIEGKSK